MQDVLSFEDLGIVAVDGLSSDEEEGTVTSSGTTICAIDFEV